MFYNREEKEVNRFALKNIAFFENFHLIYETNEFMSNAFSENSHLVSNAKENAQKTHDFESFGRILWQNIVSKALHMGCDGQERHWERRRERESTIEGELRERDIGSDTTIEWIVMKSSHDSTKLISRVGIPMESALRKRWPHMRAHKKSYYMFAERNTGSQWLPICVPVLHIWVWSHPFRTLSLCLWARLQCPPLPVHCQNLSLADTSSLMSI